MPIDQGRGALNYRVRPAGNRDTQELEWTTWTTATDVTVTERAARRIGEILGREPPGTMLRVSVEGGGCSGFQYKFDMERDAGRRRYR